MSKIIIAEQISDFIRSQYDFLNSKFCSKNPDVTVKIASGANIFDTTNIEAFNNISRVNAKIDMMSKIDGYIKSGAIEELFVATRNKGEQSTYESASTIYLFGPFVYMDIQFVQEFKGSVLFKEFTFSSGRIACDDKKFSFVEIGADWETGVKNAGWAFKQAFTNPLHFIKERQCKESKV